VVVPPAPAGPGLTTDTSHDPTASRFRRVLAGVLAVLLVLSTGLLVWLLVRGGDADDVQAEREQVMSTAQQFALRINTYGPDMLDDEEQMPDYREGVSELLTPKFAADFEENVSIAEQTVVQAGIARTGEVFATGVSDLDDDSARALVAGRIDQSVADGADRVESEPVPFR
jgi:Mce-associated membrane protein